MWNPQHYLKEGIRRGRPEIALFEGVRQIRRSRSKRPPLPAILTLCHLARRVDLPLRDLRRYVDRSVKEPYGRFKIRKRSGGVRRICVPDASLRRIQGWLSQHVLRKVDAHPCSQAFSPGSSTVKCASQHVGARWLVKMDIADFFGSITELQIFRVFESLGYNRLVSFELARLCTDLPWGSAKHELSSWRVHKVREGIPAYQQLHLGRLPQGAATSPMLANLAMKGVDVAIELIARRHGLVYSRYSDDLTFSTVGEYSKRQAKALIGEVACLLKSRGLYPNRGKTAIVHPGARRVVLGLLVDGVQPKLSRKFRDNLRQHFHYLQRFGVEEHVRARNFDSAGGLYRHLRGLIDYAGMVDSVYGRQLRFALDAIRWPGRIDPQSSST